MILRKALWRPVRIARHCTPTTARSFSRYGPAARPSSVGQSEDAVDNEKTIDLTGEAENGVGEDKIIGLTGETENGAGEEKTIDLTRETGPSIRERYEFNQNFQETTGRLGAKVGKHYKPFALLNHPPAPKDITLELLLASQAHLGHATSLWNPGNQRYIHGIRQGIHIISLEIIASHLRRAAKIVEGVVENAGLVLFVGTRAGQERCVVQAAKLAGGCHLFERWTPGAITNGQQILGHGKVVEVDKRDNRRNEVDKPKVVKPDLVVCLNPLENYVLLHECGLYAIPTIGIIDTDADPSWVTYPIPANDDSLRAVQLIAGILGRAGEEGKRRRIRRAEEQLRLQLEAASQRERRNFSF